MPRASDDLDADSALPGSSPLFQAAVFGAINVLVSVPGLIAYTTIVFKTQKHRFLYRSIVSVFG